MSEIKLSRGGNFPRDLPWELSPVSIEDIANFLSRSTGYVLELVNQPDFPSPVTSGTRNRRWLAGNVLAYLQEGATRQETASQNIGPINLHYLVNSTEFRTKRNAS